MCAVVRSAVFWVRQSGGEMQQWQHEPTQSGARPAPRPVHVAEVQQLLQHYCDAGKRPHNPWGCLESVGPGLACCLLLLLLLFLVCPAIEAAHREGRHKEDGKLQGVISRALVISCIAGCVPPSASGGCSGAHSRCACTAPQPSSTHRMRGAGGRPRRARTRWSFAWGRARGQVLADLAQMTPSGWPNVEL